MSRAWWPLTLLALAAGGLAACTGRLPAESLSAAGSEAATPSVRAEGGTRTGSLEFAGELRTYRLFVPAELEPSGAALVVALHGGGGNAANLERSIRMNELAEREGFLVVYPNGSGRLDEVLLTWNAGNCCGYALDQQVDDVGFLRALVDQLQVAFPLDPGRIYATGMSNGGMMSYRLACEAADLFAAVAPVAGALNVEDCEPSEPVSVLAIHGTADQHVLFEGGAPAVTVDTQARVDRSVHYALTFWAARDGCELEPATSQVGSVLHEIYSDCLPGLGVELLGVEGGGHAWPGAARFSPQGDEPYSGLNASLEMWEFFEAHPKPQD